MFYVFLLIIAVLGIGMYLLFFLQNVPGAAEERLGVMEPLPEDVGEWKIDAESSDARGAAAEGLRRETRTFYDEARRSLLRQARYRSIETGDIVRVEPDELLKRKRVKRAT